jgi:hypothetical protein
LAQDIDLGHVEGADDSHVDASSVPHSHLKVEIAPDTLNVARITAQELQLS